MGPEATEAELCPHMRAYLGGQIEAFDALYAAFAGRLRGCLLSQCRDATLADDLLQETFLQMHRSRRTYAGLLVCDYTAPGHVLLGHGGAIVAAMVLGAAVAEIIPRP